MGRILLLDDNADMLTAMIDLFEMNDHHIITGYSGQDGLDMLSSGQEVDMIISDITMPQMDGITFLQAIRNNTQWSHIPFTIMSGHTGDSKRAFQAGADAFICKPFKIKEIHDLLDRFLKEA